MHLLSIEPKRLKQFQCEETVCRNRLIHHAVIHVPGHHFTAGQMTVFCLIIKENISPISTQKLRLISAPKKEDSSTRTPNFSRF